MIYYPYMIYYIISNVFTATHQNKSPAFLKMWYITWYKQKYLFSRMYITLLLKLWKLYFLRNDHTTFLTCFNFNSNFLCLPKKFIFKSFKDKWNEYMFNLSNFMYHFTCYYLTSAKENQLNTSAQKNRHHIYLLLLLMNNASLLEKNISFFQKISSVCVINVTI